MKKIGEFYLGDMVDITDPCYNEDVWCRMTVDCKPGQYTAYYNTEKCGPWGERVSELLIFLDNKRAEFTESLGVIGVDAGLAGFFNNKPDYTDKEWKELCSDLGNKDTLLLPYGVISSTGYGDGSYTVSSNKDMSAFKIKFL